MNTYGTDIESGIAAANTNFSMQPVGAAIAGTNFAGSQWFK
jgi:hypothetical protein